MVIEQNDKDVALAAILNNAIALKFAGPDVKKYFDIVKIAVSNNYNTLNYADDVLKDEDDIVLSAIYNCGLALMYAGDKAKDKEFIVKKAVSHNAYAIKYASPRLQNDPEFLLELIFLNPNVLAYTEYNINEMLKLIKDNEELERLEHILLSFEENCFGTENTNVRKKI